LGDGLDRGYAVLGRLAANAITARRRWPQSVARQLGQLRIQLKELLGLPPGAVEHAQRDRTGRGLERQIARAFAGIKQDRGTLGIGELFAQPGQLSEPDTNVDLGLRQLQLDQPCGIDRNIAFSRML
jgi:hypothetical protein